MKVNTPISNISPNLYNNKVKKDDLALVDRLQKGIKENPVQYLKASGNLGNLSSLKDLLVEDGINNSSKDYIANYIALA
ncbi:MAG: hypothetical protein ACK5BE_05295 [Alphaproteobacteria bacterium]|jgi:hypothetical protein